VTGVRIIGIGNPGRGDDGLGPAVIAALQAAAPAGAELVTARGDMLALLDAWSGVERAILVDAMAPGDTPGLLVRLDAAQAPVTQALGAFASTHAFNLAETIELARALGRLPAQLVVYGVEGACFAPGAPLSPAVAQALPALLEQLLRECEACTKPL